MDSRGVVTPPYVGRPLRLEPFHALRLTPRRVGDPASRRLFARPYRAVSARLAQWQTQWDDWERRVAGARAEIARVNAAAELSPPQRAAAIEAWVAQRFDAADQPRARALLQLPPD